MPFNSTSTMPLHRIISQWSGLFLLSHALSFFFFFFPLLHCKMNHGSNRLYPGESGELAARLTNHQLQRQTHRRRSLLLFIDVQDDFPFGPKKIKRRCVRRRGSWAAPVVSLVMVSAQSQLSRVGARVCVCLWQRHSTSHDVKWEQDWSAIPSLAAPPSAS